MAAVEDVRDFVEAAHRELGTVAHGMGDAKTAMIGRIGTLLVGGPGRGKDTLIQAALGLIENGAEATCRISVLSSPDRSMLSRPIVYCYHVNASNPPRGFPSEFAACACICSLNVLKAWI